MTLFFCFEVYYLNILKWKAIVQMFFYLMNLEESWKLWCFLLESNIFVSKCFIISHINVRSILETYVTCKNCLTNTYKIWLNLNCITELDTSKNSIWKTFPAFLNSRFIFVPIIHFIMQLHGSLSMPFLFHSGFLLSLC